MRVDCDIHINGSNQVFGGFFGRQVQSKTDELTVLCEQRILVLGGELENKQPLIGGCLNCIIKCVYK